MITEDEIRNQKIWDEVIKSRQFRTEIQPHERTKVQLVAEYGLTRSNIDTIIADLLEHGIIQRRPALLNGKPCTAYSFVSGSDFDIKPK